MNYHKYGYIRNNKKITPYSKLICSKGYSEKILFFPDGFVSSDFKEFGFLFNDTLNPFIEMSLCGENKFKTLCIDPFYIYPNYRANLIKEDRMFINLENEDDCLLLVLVGEKDGKYSVNLKEPIVINTKNLLSKKVVLNYEYDSQYDIGDVVKMELI